MIISYYDREKRETVTIEISADVVEISLPPTDEDNGNLPALTVTVNTDAVIIDKTDAGKHDRQVAMYEYSDLLAD